MKKLLVFLVVMVSALLCCGCADDGPAVIVGEYIRTSTDGESYAISSEGFAPYFIFLMTAILLIVPAQLLWTWQTAANMKFVTE